MDPFQNVIYMYQEITKFRIALQMNSNKLTTIENTTTSLTAPSRSKAIV